MPEKIYTKTQRGEGYVITLERIAGNTQLRLGVKGSDETMSKATVLDLIAALQRQVEQMK